MKFALFISLFFAKISLSQTALYNTGNFQIHNNAEIGFHIDLINNGVFNENLGFVGFYNSLNSLSISGTQPLRFFDMEVDVNDNLFIGITTEIENSLSFTVGDIITPRNNPNISIDFLQNAIYVLDEDLKHIDGYTSFNGSDEFIFPIGNDNKLRPLISTNLLPNTTIKAAYFNEDPNFPSTFTTSFNTTSHETILNTISIVEFWDFDGPDNSIVTLTWNQESEINSLTSDILNLRVVGWHNVDQEWKDLGNSNIVGSLLEGAINSSTFNPTEYTILTFGAFSNTDEFTIYNLFSPNDDGVNDFFIIEGIESYNNNLEIYNRWGAIVYRANNYQNDWDGKANVSTFLNTQQRLPIGTYYYILKVPEKNTNTAGWLYINY